MSGAFEDQFKDYMSAIMAVHSKYSSKKVHDKAVEISNDVVSTVFNAIQQLNPSIMSVINSVNFVPITDAFVAQYKTKKVAKKVAKSLNVYTSIFIPIVRKVAEPILKQWDIEEPDVVYNRITSINSIASKIYKNLTDKSKYTDTYEYHPDTVEGDGKTKIKGVIVATVSNPDDFDALAEQYGEMIKTLMEDKVAIQEELKDLPDDQIKEKKATLIQEFMSQHEEMYSMIDDYIASFMDNYRDVLKEMCIDKPAKKSKKAATKVAKAEESINMDESDEGIDMNGNPQTFFLPPPAQIVEEQQPVNDTPEVFNIPAAPILPPEQPATPKQLPIIKPAEQPPAPVTRKTRKTTTTKKTSARKN